MALFAMICILMTVVGPPAALGTRARVSSRQSSSSTAPEGPPAHLCSPESCGGTRNLTLYRKIRQLHHEFPGLFLTRCEILKMNWCQVHPSRCPGGRFPEGPNSPVLDSGCGRHNNGQLAAEAAANWLQAEPGSRDVGRTSTPRTSTQATRRQELQNARASTNASRSLTSSQASDVDSLSVAQEPQTMSSQDVEGDGDRCCQTTSQVLTMEGSILDHLGDSCYVLALNDTNNNYIHYQFAQVGSCYENSAGSCDGHCHQVRKLISLLCLEPIPGSPSKLRSVFRLFYVNAYCSCRSGSSR